MNLGYLKSLRAEKEARMGTQPPTFEQWREGAPLRYHTLGSDPRPVAMYCNAGGIHRTRIDWRDAITGEEVATLLFTGDGRAQFAMFATGMPTNG